MGSGEIKYHFIGLGGIGMSALARILLQMGHRVQGSDVAESKILEELRKEGAVVRVGHSEEAIEEGSCIIYSSIIREENVEFAKAKKLQLPLLHRSDLLDRLMAKKQTLLVAGTHGKTTTTALLTQVFLEAELDPTFVIGGILHSLNTNGRAGKGVYFIAEADESDGSFLKTSAFGAIVTNIEPEHLDYWGTEEKLIVAFEKFCARVQGPLFWCYDDERLRKINPRGFSYGFSEGADLRLSSYRCREKSVVFDCTFHGKKYPQIELSLHGKHNALNGAAVLGLALAIGISEEKIRNAFRSFSGTRRRLEWKGEAHSLRVYDDYAHHPTEIKSALSALREREKERRLIALFQPHRFTRVRDQWEHFPNCFQEADEVILTEIYSAGEDPLEGITSATFYTHMREKLGSKVHFFPRAHLEQELQNRLHPLDVVVSLGAGDITSAGVPLLRPFSEKAPKLRIAVLCGGTSAEHFVSLMSARNIVRALDPQLFDAILFGITKEGKWMMGPDVIDRLEQKNSSALEISEALQELMRCDVCFPVFHGPQGEDGMMQGLFATLNIPYVGCDYRASALVMQKSWTKRIALTHSVPIAPFIEMDFPTYAQRPNLLIEAIEKNLHYPVWIKAVHLGSSIGVARAANRDEVIQAAENAFAVDDVLIAEKEIEGRLVEFAVLGNEHLRTAVPCEILNHGAFYDYERKYGPNAVGVEIPAQITPLQREIGTELAETIYRATGCKGLARVDFFLDREGHFWFNEINPLPGFTNASGYPKMWEASGMTQRELCTELIALALQKSRRLARIKT